MSNFNNSANMMLPIPIVGIAPGPEWASDINNCLTIVDGHDHTPGSGVQITPDALNINADLSINAHNLTNVMSLRFSPQNAPLAGVDDLACVYAVDADLYYNDALGNQIRITQSGGIAGTPGSIANLTPPASAEYVSGTGTFVWQSDVDKGANLDAASIILRNFVASSFGLTLSPPSLSSDYSITLPLLPASSKIMRIDNTGAIVASLGVDNSTIEISSNNLQVKDAGIVLAKMASNSVGTSQIVDAAVTQVKRAALGQQISSSSATFTTTSSSFVDVDNLSVTITTTGRPVFIGLQSDESDTGDVHIGTTSNTANRSATFQFIRGSTAIGRSTITVQVANQDAFIPVGSFWIIDTPVAGTYTYKLQAKQNSGGNTTAHVDYTKLIAYEL